MMIRLRFMLFFIAGIAAVFLPLIIFAAVGIVDVDDKHTLKTLMLALGGSAAVLAVIALMLRSVLQRFGRPVSDLLESIAQISNGNLSPNLPDNVPAEFGLINGSLNTMCGQMRMVLNQLSTLSGHVVKSTDGAGESFQEVHNGAKLQSETAARTFEAVGRLSNGLLEASRGMESLASRIDKSAIQVSQLEVAFGSITDTIGGLTASIEEASQTTLEGDRNARVLASDVVGLSTSVNSAKGALSEMVDGAQQARTNAGDAALIIGNLESETARIGEAIKDVIKGSDAAHFSNERILEVTTSLASRVDRVDRVIEVIRNLAERTKLLSINASIIASEAGEHGRAFAVVAREVKDLAQSTTGAIAEISQVVVRLKEGFAQTVETIQMGQEDVDQGIRLARNAVELLGSIPDQVQKASTSIKGIVGRTDRQVEKGRQVEEIIVKVVSTLEQVSQMLAGQVSRNDRTLALFSNISVTADQVLSSTQSHSEVSREVSRTVETISSDFRSQAGQVRGHVMSFENVVKLSKDVMNITDSNRQRAEELSSLISELNRYALYLGEDFRKLGGDGQSSRV